MSITFDVTALSVIIATLSGPVLAVQAQQWLERRRAQEGRRVTIFRTLMATRAASLSGAHVEALNAIPIEFYGTKRAYRGVVEAWRLYLDHLGQKEMEAAVWDARRQQLFVDLLATLSNAVGYTFSRVELQREIYSPIAHGRLEAEQDVIRRGLFKIFSGEAAFPLDVKSFPANPETAKTQELGELLRGWLAGQQSVKVEMSSAPPPAKRDKVA